MSDKMKWELPPVDSTDGEHSEVLNGAALIQSITNVKRRLGAIAAMRTELDSLEDTAIAELVEQDPYINDSHLIEHN